MSGSQGFGAAAGSTQAGFETDLSTPRRRRAEDRSAEYQNDAKYQKYEQLVERSLQSFEYVNEWADVTAFLTKLGRAFSLYAQYPVIPHKATVGKRLAQCLNPALPPGVHQTALNIYAQLFAQMGSDQLSADLALYASGLLPFMRHASVTAKGRLLDIFEQHVVPLGSRLRACMKALVVGLLGALDEGAPDVVARVMHVLDMLRDSVDPAFFHQTLFLAIITHARAREAALTYLAQRMPELSTQEQLHTVCGEETGLLARALAAALGDSRSLVQRAALDVVLTRVPLRHSVLKPAEVVLVAGRAAGVVLRKDMALNRRLYAWLLGPGETDAEQAGYFAQYARQPLVEALLGGLAAEEERQAAVRVLIGLADRPAIAQPVLGALLVPLLRLLLAEDAVAVRMASAARMLVEMLDPAFAWTAVLAPLHNALQASGAPDTALVTRALRLALFFVQTFALDDEASMHVHMPQALLATLTALDALLGSAHSAEEGVSLAPGFARLAVELYARIPRASFAGDEGGQQVLRDVVCLAQKVCTRLARHLAQPDTAAGQRQQHGAEVALEDTCYVLHTAAAEADHTDDLHVRLADAAEPPEWAAALADAAQNARAFGAQRVALDTLLRFVERDALAPRVLLDALPLIVQALWSRLGGRNVRERSAAVRLLLRLRAVDAELVERRVAAEMNTSDEAEYATALAHVAALWRCLPPLQQPQHIRDPPFARVLLLVLDHVDACDSLWREPWRQTLAQAWVDAAADMWTHVAAPLILLVLASVQPSEAGGWRRTRVTELNAGHLAQCYEFSGALDPARTAYLLDSLYRYLYTGHVDAMHEHVDGVLLNAWRAFSDLPPGSLSYAQLVGCVGVEVAVTAAGGDGCLDVCASAGRLAAVGAAQGVWPGELLLALQTRTVDALMLAVHEAQAPVQSALLDMLTALVHACSEDSRPAGILCATPFARLALLALTSQRSAPALRRWVLMLRKCLPAVQHRLVDQGVLLHELALPCVRALLRLLARDVHEEVVAAWLDALDVVLALCLDNAEALVHVGAQQQQLQQQQQRPGSRASSVASAQSSRPILRLVSGIFGADGAASEAEAEAEVEAEAETEAPSDQGLDLVAVLAALRDLLQAFDAADADRGEDETLAQLLGAQHVRPAPDDTYDDDAPTGAVHAHVSRILTHAAAAQPAEVAEAAVALWLQDNPCWATALDHPCMPSASPYTRPRAVSSSSAHTSVSVELGESVGEEHAWDWRAAAMLERLRVPGAAPDAHVMALLDAVHRRMLGQPALRFSSVPTSALLRYVELCAPRLTAPAQLCSSVVQLLRDPTDDTLLPYVLRACTALCMRLAGRAAVYSHDLCSLYARLVETCVQTSGRLSAEDSAAHILRLTAAVLPQLPHLLPDHELQLTVGGAVMQYAVGPALRAHMTGGLSASPRLATSQSRLFPHVLLLLSALTRHAALSRLWTRDVGEFFADNKFFAPPAMSRETMPTWRLVVRALLVADKPRFNDTLARVQSAASQAALFANRDAEARVRAASLRRLSFLLWASPVDQHAGALPLILERLADVLKHEWHAHVHAEVFLCLRVLLCRVAPRHMSGFWPVLLAEMMRLCVKQLSSSSAGAQTLEQANLFLAMCKFLDLLLVLCTEDFVVHQWIFVTDTVDALYASKSASVALLDQLSARLLSTPAAARPDDPSNLVFRAVPAHVLDELDRALPPERLLPPDQLVHVAGPRPLKRPVIRMRRVNSPRDLDAFVHSASLLNYQAAYLLAEPDVNFIDALLQNDLMYLDFEHPESSDLASPGLLPTDPAAMPVSDF